MSFEKNNTESSEQSPASNQFVKPEITEFQNMDANTIKQNLMNKLIIPRSETFLSTKTTEEGDKLIVELFVDINDGGATKAIKFKIESKKESFIQDTTEQIQEHTKSLSGHSDLMVKSLMFQVILKNKDNLEKGYTNVRI
jgi:hypothetical protein